MFIYKSRFLTRGEVWFDDEPDDVPVDWIYYRQRSGPVPGSRWKYFHTLLIDLRKSPAELLSEMDTKTVRRINEAREKDRTVWGRCDVGDPNVMEDIERRWNAFAEARQSARLDRDWFDRIIESGALVITAGKDPGGNVLSYHVSYVGEKRAQQLIIVSQYTLSPNVAVRSQVNRANCLGHWHSLLTLKERGLRWFDFGGWYPGSTDMKMLGMNAFKKGFGGQVVREYNCEQVRTLKCWVMLTTARLLERARSLRSGSKSSVAQLSPAKTQQPAVLMLRNGVLE